MTTPAEKLRLNAVEALKARSLWNEKLWRLWSALCAEQVLGIFERERSSPSPRNAIDMAKAFARGHCGLEQLLGARGQVAAHRREADARQDQPSEAARFAEFAAMACCATYSENQESLIAVTSAASATLHSAGLPAAEQQRYTQVTLLLSLAGLGRLRASELLVLFDRLEARGVDVTTVEAARVQLQHEPDPREEAVSTLAVFALALPLDVLPTAQLPILSAHSLT